MQKKDNKAKFIIYTDGACLGNPGPGGWAALIQGAQGTREIFGGEPETTNNRMEILALLKALESLHKYSSAEVYTDSKYLHDAINKGWLTRWVKNGWQTAAKTPVKNRDLWERLLDLMQGHDLVLHWVKAHNGQPENERCDSLARSEAEKQI